MPARDDHDILARARLSALAEELVELDERIVAAVDGRAALPWPLPEIFVRLTAAAEICEKILEQHATAGARVSDATLLEVARTLCLVREVTTGLLRIALAATSTGS